MVSARQDVLVDHKTGPYTKSLHIENRNLDELPRYFPWFKTVVVPDYTQKTGTLKFEILSPKLTWKWRGAHYKTTILYIGPFMSFHVSLGEGKRSTVITRNVPMYTMLTRRLSPVAALLPRFSRMFASLPVPFRCVAQRIQVPKQTLLTLDIGKSSNV